MPEEMGSTINNLVNVSKKKFGDLEIFSGDWKTNMSNDNNLYISIGWSGWGKVSSARAATRIISSNEINFPIDFLLFTGVAGAIDDNLKQWDIVLPSKLVQHDMDARPLFEKYEIPALRTKNLNPDSDILNWTKQSISNAKEKGILKNFGNIYQGVVATGDKFVNCKEFSDSLIAEIDGLLAVEMEGASVAQVAMQENIPWQVIRVISDSANNDSPQDFKDFLNIYNNSSSQIIESFIENIDYAPF